MQILHTHVTHSRVLANIHIIPVYVATTKQTNAAAEVLTCNSNAMSNIDTKTGDSFQTAETLCKVLKEYNLLSLESCVFG